MKARYLFAIAILSLFASAALAEDMNPALKQLGYFVGKWRCTGTDSMMGPAHATLTNVGAKWGYAGHWLVVDVDQQKTKENPMGFMGTVFMGYDEGSKKLVNTWVDNMGGYATANSEGWMADKITYTGPQHMGPTTMNIRDVFTKQGNDKLTHVMLMEENGAWKQFADETCMRKK